MSRTIKTAEIFNFVSDVFFKTNSHCYIEYKKLHIVLYNSNNKTICKTSIDYVFDELPPQSQIIYLLMFNFNIKGDNFIYKNKTLCNKDAYILYDVFKKIIEIEELYEN